MNAAATQDVRAIDTVPLLKRLLKGTTAPTPQAQQMLDLLVAWKQRGGSRLDRDLDGLIDDPGAAVMDGSWNTIADAFMAPKLGDQLDELDSLFSRFNLPPGGQYDGWYQYFDRDIRALLGKKVKSPFDEQLLRQRQAQGVPAGDLGRDRGRRRRDRRRAGHPRPVAVALRRVRERIEFVPGLLETTMRYTNRPSGIQQVISFDGHR